MVISPRFWKFTFLFMIAALLCFASGETRHAIAAALSDAYIQVSTFVAITLIIFYVLERKSGFDLSLFFQRNQKWQVPVAALLGALPGCGGAIIVITQYVTGRLSFGGMIAVLTSTMGDAAFLLIAKEPMTALMVMCVSLVAGTITGLLADRIHGPDFMRPPENDPENLDHALPIPDTHSVDYHRYSTFLWFLIFVPGLVLAISSAFQFDLSSYHFIFGLSDMSVFLGMAGAVLGLFLWASLSERGVSIINMLAHPSCKGKVTITHRVMFETSFVTAWVIAAFLIFELGTLWFNIDLAQLFRGQAAAVPLVAALIGFIPGCGPQIIVTTLYLAGIIPLSAQMANAISNDGDALFPAIAMAPRVAILATAYTAFPALIVGYGFYFAGY